MVLNNQIKHPTDKRYHRINVQNANFCKALALPNLTGVLEVLGWVPSGNFWRWRAGFKDETTDETLERLPNEEELMALRMARDILHEESLGFACEVRGECGSSDD
mmetsp:Transcript_2010/g.4518  ORF Transcript_2010/g.4518 Transcript_2010/m.4518 type:complete len:105 (-) Transcript_2010:212-526(-)